MPRFFISKEDLFGDEIHLHGENAHHIVRVLRMNVGEKLTLCDLFNEEYECTLTGIENGENGISAIAHIESVKSGVTEPPYEATLYMALPKGDKMEWIIQKSVELGVKRIVPFSSSRTVVKLDSQNKEKKRSRWQKIAENAAGQCGRGLLPQVEPPMTYKEALLDAKLHQDENSLSFICYEGEEQKSVKTLLEKCPDATKIQFFVGAEGGFSVEEIDLARNEHFETVTLGKRILRCETAPLYLLSSLSFFFEL